MDIKEQILNSAIELFSKRGFDGVSIRQIADHAQIHFASIRYHFGGKTDLYRECISKHGESRLVSAQRFLGSKPKGAEDMRLRLGYAIEDTFRIHSENPHLTKLLLLEIESSNPQSDSVLKKTMVAMSGIYVAFFKECQKKKLISTKLDPLFLTQSLMGILHHFMRTESIRERLLSHKDFKNKQGNKVIIDNILTLFLGE